nr:1-(5-phosphoribosyl)-5-[(5-phosphoribosylamino)methylideneamino] imidazole-4-carboxamide isomerase [uncultured Sphingosinicella sp.]
MIIYPAMDLMGGRPVRLAQGRFDDATGYMLDPAEAVLAFEEAGAEWAHVVDLDGARDGCPRQHGMIVDIALSVSVKLQVAGGFREADHFTRVFDAGVDRVVIGSLAAYEPEKVRGFFESFGGEKLALALDVKLEDGVPIVATRGWTELSGKSLWEVAAFYPEAKHLLVTDIGRDGMLTGPNTELIAEVAARLPSCCLQASGGVSSLDDLRDLKAARAAGAIVGKALWEQRIDLKQAIDAGA